MAVIFSYPIKSTPDNDDLILISDGTDRLTKQVRVNSLPFSNNAGTVTSVGISMPSAFAVANSPVTSSNTIEITTTGGSAGQYLAHDGTWGTPAGGAANPAGALTQIQYHDTGGVFGASANLSFSTDRLTLTDTLEIKGDGVNPGTLKLYCEDTTTPHAVSILGPIHSGATPYSIRLPKEIAIQTAYSSGGRVLESNASGALQWIATPTGGSGSSYQAGNGIDINTGTNPDTISTGLLVNGGIVFNSNKMQVDLAATAMSGELRAVDGGTGFSTYAVGDLLYAETTTTLSALNIGANDKILGVNNGGTTPQWITNLVGQEVPEGSILVGNTTNAMTQLDTSAKGTIAVGNGTTTTSLSVGSDAKVLTAKSAAATGLSWETITFPTVDLTSGVTGELPVANGGTGLSTIAQSGILRGNGVSDLIADSYLAYEGTSKSLKVRGLGNTAPSLSCTLGINDAQGPTGKVACIGLTPTGAQGAKAMHLDLGAYNTGIQVNRNNSLASNAMLFQQNVSGSTQVGSITMSNSATAFNTSSDYRLKENVVDMTGAIDRVKQLKPSRFNFISESDSKVVDGFLAHEVSNIVPEAITGTKDEVDADGNPVYQGIDQSKLVPLLVGAIKELTARIEALES